MKRIFSLKPICIIFFALSLFEPRVEANDYKVIQGPFGYIVARWSGLMSDAFVSAGNFLSLREATDFARRLNSQGLSNDQTIRLTPVVTLAGRQAAGMFARLAAAVTGSVVTLGTGTVVLGLGTAGAVAGLLYVNYSPTAQQTIAGFFPYAPDMSIMQQPINREIRCVVARAYCTRNWFFLPDSCSQPMRPKIALPLGSDCQSLIGARYWLDYETYVRYENAVEYPTSNMKFAVDDISSIRSSASLGDNRLPNKGEVAVEVKPHHLEMETGTMDSLAALPVPPNKQAWLFLIDGASNGLMVSGGFTCDPTDTNCDPTFRFILPEDRKAALPGSGRAHVTMNVADMDGETYNWSKAFYFDWTEISSSSGNPPPPTCDSHCIAGCAPDTLVCKCPASCPQGCSEQTQTGYVCNATPYNYDYY